MRGRVWIVLGGVVLLGLLAWALLPRMLVRRDATASEAAAAVIVSSPRIGSIERTLLYSGTLKPKSSVAVTTKIPGRIERILVEEGELVGKDQPLVRMEEDAVRLQMQQAAAAWQAAQAQYDKARRGVRAEELENARALHNQAQQDLNVAEEGFQRSERMFRSGAIAKAQYEEAESALRSARTQLENAGRTVKMLAEGASPEDQEMARSQAQAAKASYDLARLQVDHAGIRAPVAGVVARILQDEGNSVGPMVPILILVQEDPILAEVAVPERHYGELTQRREQVECRVRPAAYPGAEPFIGTVTAVAPTISPGSRTFTVTIEMPNPEQLLRPGMYAEVELVMERRDQAVLVSETTVLERNGQSIVFVVDATTDGRRPAAAGGATARQRVVQLGLSVPGAVEIRRGVSPEELVIVEGNTFLEDGQRIQILESR